MSAARKPATTAGAAVKKPTAGAGADKKKADGKAAGAGAAKDRRPKGLPVLKVSVPLAAEARQARRRLSLATGNPADKDKNVTSLDGAAPPDSTEHKKESEKARAGKKKKGRQFGAYASLSKVGFVPFNPNKINQDRALEAVKFGGNESRALFGVFDGHGLLGHEVSQFISTELPGILAKQPALDKKPKASLVKAFLDANAALLKTKIDCTYSGTTGVVVYFNGGKLHCANAGDSRAVLATTNAALKAPEPVKPAAADGKSAAVAVGAAAPAAGAGKDTPAAGAGAAATAPAAAVAGKLRAVPLSFDHKPDVPEERKRIVESKGRVHPCKTADGADIGPSRVWIATEDVPGLAMTRSFGDNVAASVGVCPNPQIVTHAIHPLDSFVIIASDGVWEFISNQEAVDIVAQADTPEAACRLLLNESTNRWQREEEVIDDITIVVVFMQSYAPPPPPDPFGAGSSLHFAGADGAKALAAGDGTSGTPSSAAATANAAAAAPAAAAPAAAALAAAAPAASH